MWLVFPAQKADIEEIHSIEEECFPTPWSKDSFHAELSHSYSHLWIAKSSKTDSIVGFICFWVLWDEMHILNVAVRKKFQGKGIGSLLLKKAIQYAIKKGLEWIGLEVRETNIKAIRLYEKFGFQKQGRRPRYYYDTGEDAILMALKL